MRTDIREEVDRLLADKATVSVTLEAYIRKLHREGMTKDEIMEAFTDLMVLFREAGRNEDDDLMYDFLDAMTGNCHPSCRIDLE